MKRSTLLKAVLCGGTLILSAVEASALQDATTSFSSAETTIRGVLSTFLNIVSLVIGMVAVYMLTPVVIKAMKGDPNSGDILLKYGGAVAGAVIFLQLVRIIFLS